MDFKKNILKLMALSLVLSVHLLAAETPKDATSFTKEKNEQVLKELPLVILRILKTLNAVLLLLLKN